MKRFFILLGISLSCYAHPLVKAARHQIGLTLTYNPAYRKLTYPMGDLPITEGVCTDVIIRAFRKAYGIDLQKAIHEDMKKAPYPRQKVLDPSIDHRRVPNIATFLKRHKLEIRGQLYQPGDIVTWNVMGLPHIGLVSTHGPLPFIIHNIGSGTQEEAFLPYKVTSHFRLSPSFIRKYTLN